MVFKVSMCATKSTSFQIFGATAAATAVVVTAVLLTWHYAIPPEKDDVHYPDLVSSQASSCWEANVFATSNDPFYKWVRGTSIPSLLIKGGQLSTAIYSAAYQKMSVWRASGKDNFLYAAPDPRLTGGIIRQHAKSWISKMQIHWGIGIRLCAEGWDPNTSPPGVQRCQLTIPIVPIPNSAANASAGPALAALYVQVPFNSSFSSSGYYLTNFASSAKSNVSLGVNRRNDQANLNSSSTWYYFQDNIKECKPRLPVCFLPDVVSGYEGRRYQCGCIAGACIIGRNLMNISDVLGQGCDTALSFWDTDVDFGKDRIGLQTYSPRRDTSYIFVIALTFSNSIVTDAFSKIAPGLGRITKCIELWLDSEHTFNITGIKEPLRNLSSTCHHNNIDIIGGGDIRTGTLERHVENIVTRLLNEEQNETELDCGLQSKLAKEPLCYIMLNNESTEGIQRLLKDVLALAQVRQYGEMVWHDDSQKRSQVYLALLTSIITLFSSMFGLLSRSMMDAENAVLRHAPRCLPTQSQFHKSLLRTVVRSLVLLGSVGAVLISLFYSMKDVNKERGPATSDTILHFDRREAFLVTTTSTVEVKTNWIVFIIFIAFVSLLVVPFSIVIFFKVNSSDEGKCYFGC